MMIASRRWMLVTALVVGAFVVLVFVGPRTGDVVVALRSVPSLERPPLVVLGALVMALTLFAYGVLWHEICLRIEGAGPGRVDALSVFFASWLGRYVPSSAPYVAGKLVLGRRIGFSRSTVAASIFYENVLLIGVGASTAGVVLPLMLSGTHLWPVFVAVSLASAIGLAVLASPLVSPLTRGVMGLARLRGGQSLPLLNARALASMCVLSAVALALNGLAFSILLAAFEPIAVREAIAAVAIFNLAGAAGLAAIPVPSGIGVREAVLFALLAMIVPPDVAVASSLMVRAISVMLDLGFGAAGLLAIALRAPSAQRSSAAQLSTVTELDT